MPRFSLRSATPVLVCAGLVVGMIATTGAALPHAAPASESTATARSEAVSAPLAQITSQGQSALLDARAAIDEARQVTVDIRTSGLDVGTTSTVVNTAPLGTVIEKLEDLDVTPALLIPSLTAEAATATQSVREQAAMLRGRLDAAIAKKAEEEAAAKAAAEAAAAQAAAESNSSSGGSSVPSVDVNVDPASAQGIGRSMAAANYGWGDDQFACLLSLWNRESGWRVNAANSSGAYGIPQALPGSKMASAGADWQTNPATQIAWGLGYIAGRYGTPCGAWDHSESNGWY